MSMNKNTIDFNNITLAEYYKLVISGEIQNHEAEFKDFQRELKQILKSWKQSSRKKGRL
jgi:formate-dependent nitrite reductase cytochrome c552 subunit